MKRHGMIRAAILDIASIIALFALLWLGLTFTGVN